MRISGTGSATHATFSNTAGARECFAALTLLPWVNKIEREFSRVVINDPDVTSCGKSPRSMPDRSKARHTSGEAMPLRTRLR